MSKRITKEEIVKSYGFFNKMYDAVRLVDPAANKVLEFKGHLTGKNLGTCYETWNKNKLCDNCISIRAYYSGTEFIKFEQKGNVIMMVMAIPVDSEEPVVLELIKDTTNSMILESDGSSNGQIMSELINKVNKNVILDSLTGLYNRRFVDEQLPASIVNAFIEKMPLSVFFIDIDNLKKINDEYGHWAGDSTIKEVSKIIENSIKKENAWAARYGGDEFLICLHKTDKNNAHSIAQQIRENIEKTHVLIKGVKINPSVTIGSYTMIDEKLTPQELIDLVDKNMYQAKKQGKNRVYGN